MDLDIKTRSATFVSPVESTPDTEVRMLLSPNNTIDFTVRFNEGERFSGTIPDQHRLQGAEALQFVADQVGGTVEGRLSAFVRGWISVAHDVHSLKFEQDEAEEMWAELQEYLLMNPPGLVPGFTAEESEVSRVLAGLMNLAHANGLRVAQAIEARIRGAK